MKYFATISWSIAVALLVGVSWLYVGETHTFNGVAEASETVITVEASAEVLGVKVTPGQVVKKGDTLVVLRRGELTLRISELSRELEGNQGKLSMGNSEADQRIATIRAEFESRKGQLQFEMAQLEEQRTRNKEITARLKSLPTNSGGDASDALLQRINAIKSELSTMAKNTQQQVALLQGSQGLQRKIGAAERKAMENELTLLRAEESKLTILSSIDGIVATVNYSPGDRVAAFTPIVSLSAHSPTLVRGYIPEKVYTSAAIGDSVKVVSVALRGEAVYGRIIGVGSRIVELPVRLRKAPDVIVWGREVMVRIPAQNQYLLGEMVSVQNVQSAAKVEKQK